MAEDKPDKADKAKEPEPKKRRLLPIILVAVGAILGGAGTAFFLPKMNPASRQPVQPRIVTATHPDVIELVFNPRTEHGHKQARVSFNIRYEADMNERDRILALMAEHWDLMRSRALMTLMRRTPQELHSDDGIRHLTSDLVKELQSALFPDDDAKIVDIAIQQIIVQG